MPYRSKGSKSLALWLEAKEGAPYRVDRQGRGFCRGAELWLFRSLEGFRTT